MTIKVHILSKLVSLGKRLSDKSKSHHSETETSVQESDIQNLLTQKLADRMEDRFVVSTADALFKRVDPTTPPPWLDHLVHDPYVAETLEKLHDSHPNSTFLNYCHEKSNSSND